MRSRIPLVACAVIVLAALPAGVALTQNENGLVRVLNFPALQRIEGEVEVVRQPARASFVRLGEQAVPPIQRHETANLVALGTLATDGWRTVRISLVGDMKSSPTTGGDIGLVLVPDEAPFRTALRDEQQLLLPLEVRAGVAAGERTAVAATATFEVAFPRYRAYLYNSTNRIAGAQVFAYLSR